MHCDLGILDIFIQLFVLFPILYVRSVIQRRNRNPRRSSEYHESSLKTRDLVAALRTDPVPDDTVTN